MQPGAPGSGQDPYGQQPVPSSSDPNAPQAPQYPSAPGYPPAPPAPQYPGGPPQYPGAPVPGPAGPNNSLGLISLILGIISVVLGICCLGGVVVGIAAAVLGFLGKQNADQGKATNGSQAMTGMILGVAGIAISIVSRVAFTFLDINYF